MLNFDPQGHDPGRVMILYESPSMKVHIYQFLHFYHKVNDLAKIWSLSAGLFQLYKSFQSVGSPIIPRERVALFVEQIVHLGTPA